MPTVAEDRASTFQAETDFSYIVEMSRTFYAHLEVLMDIVDIDIEAAIQQGINRNDTEPRTLRNFLEVGDEDLMKLPFTRFLCAAYAEARYGVLIDPATFKPSQDHHALMASLDILTDTASTLGAGEFHSFVDSVTDAIHARRNDFKLPISLGALALMGDASIKTLRNLATPSAKNGLPVNEHGRVLGYAAREWLVGRKGFYDTLDDAAYERSDEQPSRQSETLIEPIFIPVSQDGSRFWPDLKRGGGYTIGHVGAEEKYERFDDALCRLERMARPAWRRPNSSGNWGIVSAVNWVRVDRNELRGAEEDVR